MVLVDIFVPSLDKIYNFSLNEHVPVSSIVEEITEIVEQKERSTFKGDVRELRLYNRKTQSPLPVQNTLEECFVTTGSNLLLV